MTGTIDIPTRIARPRGPLAAMRIRKKLLVLHTVFSIGLAVILLLSLRPAIANVVARGERSSAEQFLAMTIAGAPLGATIDGVESRHGDAETMGLAPTDAARVRSAAGEPLLIGAQAGPAWSVVYLPDRGEFVAARVADGRARQAVVHLYVLLTVALLAAYAMVAIGLEVFVLPQHVYGPIRRMLAADRATRESRSDDEIIPDQLIPADELGEIMRSRNETIRQLREHETALAEAFGQIERVATDLKRKNHLLETARQNLADADRLASLGMMSVGIAHELNTPLSVLKGLVERLNDDPAGLTRQQARLMARVVGRLERLSESLLDFARARPPVSEPVEIRRIADEAVTLVRLDRDTGQIGFSVEIDERIVVVCDADRMIQVLVNLIRNAADALRNGPGSIEITAATSVKDGSEWVSVSIADDGPGIDPAVLPNLFDPFVSTRLDSRGTGLGLAVAEGIVQEHGGVILAQNRHGRSGAIFEIMMPLERPAAIVGAE